VGTSVKIGTSQSKKTITCKKVIKFFKSKKDKIFPGKLKNDNLTSYDAGGWKLPIKGRPHQVREPREMSQTEKRVVDKEIQSILEKIDIKRTCQPNREVVLCTTGNISSPSADKSLATGLNKSSTEPITLWARNIIINQQPERN